MPAPLPSSPFRKVLVLAASAGLLAGATPAAAVAGGAAKVVKPPKCDPAVAVCDDGRKNG
jgi:hypothetical protein